MGIDLLREAVRVVSQEVSELVGAAKHERSEGRRGYRNGYPDQVWQTRVGAVQLRIPKLRHGSYFPSLLAPRRRSEQALLSVVQSAYIEWVSTRKVEELLQGLGLTGMDKSRVSRICKALNEVVKAMHPRWPKAAQVLEEAEEDAVAYMAFPREHWTRIRSANPLERVNKEVKRRTDVVGIFPGQGSVGRLVGSILMEMDDEWQVDRRCFNHESMRKLTEPELERASPVSPLRLALVR